MQPVFTAQAKRVSVYRYEKTCYNYVIKKGAPIMERKRKTLNDKIFSLEKHAFWRLAIVASLAVWSLVAVSIRIVYLIVTQK